MVVHKHLPRFTKIFQTSEDVRSPCPKKKKKVNTLPTVLTFVGDSFNVHTARLGFSNARITALDA